MLCIDGIKYIIRNSHSIIEDIILPFVWNDWGKT